MLKAVLEEYRAGLLSAGILAAVSAALWLPFGLSVGGTVEEWLYLDRFGRSLSPFALYEQLLRPLGYLQTYLPFLLTPGSFVGLNLLHWGFIWGKGVTLYGILRRLGLRPEVGLCAAVLFILFPADTGQMTLRTTVIQGHVMFFLLAFWGFLELERKFRVGLTIATILLLSFSLLIYEAAYPLAIACPLLLLARGTWPVRQKLKVWGLWYGALALLVGRYVFVFLTVEETYHADIVAAEPLSERLGNMALHLGLAYKRVLWDGWQEAVGSLHRAGGEDLGIGLAAALGVLAVVAVVGNWQKAGESRSPQPFPRQLLWQNSTLWGVVALVVVAAGFAMYLPTQVRSDTWRTFFLPSIGGGLLFAVALRLLCSSLGRYAFALATGLLAGLGVVHLLAQHRSFAEVSWDQQELLAAIHREAPSLDEKTRLVVLFDRGNRAAISPEMFPYSRYFRAGLSFLYGLENLNAQVCYPFLRRRGEWCELGADGLQIEHREEKWLAPQLEWQVPYSQVVAFERDREGRVSLLETLPEWVSLEPGGVDYRPQALVGSTDDPKVQRSLLKVEPLPARPQSARSQPRTERSSQFEIEFDGDQFFGLGWGGLRATAGGITYRFMPHERAALHFPLAQRAYRIDLRIANGISAELLGSLQLLVGGETVLLERIAPGVYGGDLAAERVPSQGDTTLLFQVDGNALRRAQEEKGPLVGLGFDWVRIEERLEGGVTQKERSVP